jgi:hypothetical protein
MVAGGRDANKDNYVVSGHDGIISHTTTTSTVAALGTSWFHCVTTRLWMDVINDEPRQVTTANNSNNNDDHFQPPLFQTQQQHQKEYDRQIHRIISVRKSGVSPFAAIPFEISTRGLVEVWAKK